MINIKRIIISLLFFFLFTATVNAKINIAVMNLKPVGVDSETAIGTSNIIRNELIKKGDFNVIERNQLDSILKEQGLQMTGALDQNKAIKVGKLVSAEKILIGEVNSIGSNIVITVRIVDVEKGFLNFHLRNRLVIKKTLQKGLPF